MGMYEGERGKPMFFGDLEMCFLIRYIKNR